MNASLPVYGSGVFVNISLRENTVFCIITVLKLQSYFAIMMAAIPLS